MTMRDAFWNKIFDMAEGNHNNIAVITADMGAPALDKFKREFPHRYINTGIAEQSAILTACGMALEGFRPLVYGIMPFVSLRCYEQIKVVASLMNIPITIVGVGSGFSYEDSGPTHHAVEDLAIMKILPNMRVFNCSTNRMAEHLAVDAVCDSSPAYIRLDRKEWPDIEYEGKPPFRDGIIQHKKGVKKTIITTGSMVHTALKISEYESIGVIEIFKFPFSNKALVDMVGDKEVYVIDEHCFEGLCGSVCEAIGVNEDTHYACLGENRYDYVYGGRDNILKHHHLDTESLIEWIQSV